MLLKIKMSYSKIFIMSYHTYAICYKYSSINQLALNCTNLITKS